MKTLRHSFAAIVIGILSTASHCVMAQVSLAPTFVYVDSPERFGSVVVTNGSTHVQEVIINYSFGYPSADSSGRRYIRYNDAAAEERHDLSGWIRSFPQRFRVEPGRRQVVRMIVEPPHGLQDGVYWTRMTVTASESDAGDDSTPQGTSAQLDFRVKQVIPVVYRKGNPSTGVRVADLFSETDARGTDIRVVLEREGDAPFFGTAVLRLIDASGVRVKEISTSSDVYFSSSTHFHLEADDIAPGTYTAEVSLSARRSDVGARRLPAVTSAARRFSIEIPEPARTVADAE